ncbi:phosphatase PAP2 family protein, partial [Nocardia sp. NPDC004722]
MTAAQPTSSPDRGLHVVPDAPAAPVASPAEVKIINLVQGTIGQNPAVIKAARGMSHFGEHSLGWLGIAAVGALVDKPRRREWAGVAV